MDPDEKKTLCSVDFIMNQWIKFQSSPPVVGGALLP